MFNIQNLINKIILELANVPGIVSVLNNDYKISEKNKLFPLASWNSSSGYNFHLYLEIKVISNLTKMCEDISNLLRQNVFRKLGIWNYQMNLHIEKLKD